MAFDDDEVFLPLPNFQPGDVDFMNTCFIAVIVNLRYLIPAVFTVLGLSSLSWKQVIKMVRRTKWDGKYGYDNQYRGQHDAAELLGDILWEVPDCKLLFKKSITYLGCHHFVEVDRELSMIALTLPPDEKSSSISELFDAFTGVQQLSDCLCSCGVSNQQAESTMLLQGVQPNFCAFQVLRFFQDGGKRKNDVYVDPVLNLGGFEYRLSAVIEHVGASEHGGHYIVYCHTSSGWQCRNDASCTCAGQADIPPCNAANVYVAIYKKVEEASCDDASSDESIVSWSDDRLYFKYLDEKYMAMRDDDLEEAREARRALENAQGLLAEMRETEALEMQRAEAANSASGQGSTKAEPKERPQCFVSWQWKHSDYCAGASPQTM